MLTLCVLTNPLMNELLKTTDLPFALVCIVNFNFTISPYIATITSMHNNYDFALITPLIPL